MVNATKLPFFEMKEVKKTPGRGTKSNFVTFTSHSNKSSANTIGWGKHEKGTSLQVVTCRQKAMQCAAKWLQQQELLDFLIS